MGQAHQVPAFRDVDPHAGDAEQQVLGGVQALFGAILQVEVGRAGVEQQHGCLGGIFGKGNEAGIVHG
ncbi:hypothetical protein FQZ97_1270200 [compost metagenome]